MSARGWPVALAHGPVGVRPLRLRDGPVWVEIRLRNEEWLLPWEATPPGMNLRGSWAQRQSFGVFRTMHRALRRQARAGFALPLAITVHDRLVGQMTVSGISRGAFQSAFVGYWVDSRVAGRGVTPTALSLVVDHCFGAAGLHRIEANIRPENVASKRVVEKLGFRNEGLRPRLLSIDGAWRDHLSYALTAEDVPGGLLRRWAVLRP